MGFSFWFRKFGSVSVPWNIIYVVRNNAGQNALKLSKKRRKKDIINIVCIANKPLVAAPG